MCLDESGTDEAECRRKVASGGGLQVLLGLVNARGVDLECASVLHEILLVPVLMYGSERNIWKEKQRSRIRIVQMNNLRCLLGITRMGKIPNAWLRELCGMPKGLDEMSNEGVLRVFSHVERWRMTGLLRRPM